MHIVVGGFKRIVEVVINLNMLLQLQPTVNKMSGNTKDLDAKAAAGETVVEGARHGQQEHAGSTESR